MTINHRFTSVLQSLQIEVTTRCNLNCSYCAGRFYQNQRDMSLEQFQGILDTHVAKYGRPSRVIIQGEGEPTLNAELFAMAEYCKRQKFFTSLTTNGLHSDRDSLIKHFDEIFVSIDTINPEEANKLGRLNIQKVLEAVEYYRSKKKQVFIQAVQMPDINQDKALQAWARAKGIKLIVLPLSSKQEYIKVYKGKLSMPFSELHQNFNCRHVKDPERYFYTIDGTLLPCCYIKDTTAYPGMDAMLKAIKTNTCPQVCQGCRFANLTNK